MWDLSWIRNRTRVSFLRRLPYELHPRWATREASLVAQLLKITCNAGDLGSIPGWATRKPSRFWSGFVSHKSQDDRTSESKLLEINPNCVKGFPKAHLKGECTLHLLCLSNGCCLFWGQAGQWGGCERMAFWLGSQVSEERQILELQKGSLGHLGKLSFW